MRTIRAVIFDRTCRGGGAVGLSHAWWSGVKLYRALGRVDVTSGPLEPRTITCLHGRVPEGW